MKYLWIFDYRKVKGSNRLTKRKYWQKITEKDERFSKLWSDKSIKLVSDMYEYTLVLEKHLIETVSKKNYAAKLSTATNIAKS